MSKNENIKETPVNEEKQLTRYERRQQKKGEQEKKAKKEKMIFLVVGIVLAAIIIGVIATFPARKKEALNAAYLVVNGEEIDQVEFDYHYSLGSSSFYNSYGLILGQMGVDWSGDLSQQMYSQDMSWKDYFQKLALDNIRQYKTLLAEAAEKGFTYDATADIEDFKRDLTKTAAASGMTESAYLQSAYGELATIENLEEHIASTATVNAYFDYLWEQEAPSDEEAQAHYEENKDSYDVVDYRVTMVDAELPKEPTDLADPDVEWTGTDEEGNEVAYTPSEAEVEKAMADAEVKAKEALESVDTDGTLNEGSKFADISDYINTWLFDAARKEGDTTIIEAADVNRYYVVKFEKRYLVDDLTATIRVLSMDDTAQSVYDAWVAAGDTSEESFIQLFKDNASISFSSNYGLYEGLAPENVAEELRTWVFEEGRKPGDTTAVVTENGSGYIAYFVESGDPQWMYTIKTELFNEGYRARVEEAAKNVVIEDPNGNVPVLAYLKMMESMQ